ncbi:ABC-2 family transporter protein [Polystyrenella longa]|uniref:ABC-2 family transporter protein n=1 Tax=Polystyrenella longa TaxID=2528007 RepID=A0A518CHM6_9PLAN|nr:ABC transporter permease subunit/CPBP intramembrane protease [Polystyrenella longa]QDU78721.1 ABC-2 family transporter protein [Polystyrenella longa]
MNWRNIRLIFMREVRDLLRDRRTLFMVFMMPLLLYPALGIGMAQMMLSYREKVRTVVVLGEEHLPPPPLLADGQFAGRWFPTAKESSQLEVVTPQTLKAAEGDLPENPTEGVRTAQQDEVERLKLLVDNAKNLGNVHQKLMQLNGEYDQLLEQKIKSRKKDDEGKESPETSSPSPADSDLEKRMADLQQEIELTHDELSDLFAISNMQVLILVPDGFAESIEKTTTQIAERNITEEGNGVSVPSLTVLHNNADQKSQIAYSRVRTVLALWEADILKQRLTAASLPESITSPVNPKSVDLASAQELSANVWGTIIPALLIIMAMTGAFYPAIDLAAGEKERGTMETLLICPASRTEIVWGKFFTVLSFSIATAILNLVSLGFTTKYMVALGGGGSGGLAQLGVIAPPSLEAICWVVILLIPIAALFSALSFALATFARSSKEGQYYLTPMLAVTTGLTVFCASPAVEITPFYSIMPVIGVGLLLKGLLSSPDVSMMLIYVIPVLITSTGYSLLALWWAIDQFCREDVLFREAERFNLGLWIKQLLREKQATPTFPEAGLCFLLIMFLQFATMNLTRSLLGPIDESAAPTVMLKLLLIQQIALIAAPALIMGAMLAGSLRQTFKIYMPPLPHLLIGISLPFVLHPLVIELAQSLQWFFPPLPEQVEQALLLMQDNNISPWLLLLTFAAAPAICEEIAFRGFILSGLAHHGRLGIAIVFSSLAFGLMHMIPQQVFNASLLGLVLGLLCLRSNSLLPGILFHFVNNGIEVLRGVYQKELQSSISPGNLFVTYTETEYHYHWPTLIICGIVSAALIYWLYQNPARLSPAQQQPAADKFRLK